jgi:hypothetical protein
MLILLKLQIVAQDILSVNISDSLYNRIVANTVHWLYLSRLFIYLSSANGQGSSKVHVTEELQYLDTLQKMR